MRRLLALLAPTLGAALALAGTAAAGPVLVAKADFVQSCLGTGQACGQPVSLPFTVAALTLVLTTPSGAVTTIRDGAIRVSIARIRSGALPGLTGILAL